jgi:hypothetical protein
MADVLRLQRQEPHLGVRHLRHLPLPRLLRLPPQPRRAHHLRQVRTPPCAMCFLPPDPPLPTTAGSACPPARPG